MPEPMTHNEEPHPKVDKTLVGTALAVAPAAVGCAVGVLIGSKLKKGKREAVATALFTLGALAAVPAAIDCVAKLVNGPDSRAGAKRTLKGIRHADGIPPFEDPYSQQVEDYSAEFRKAN